MAFPKGTKVRQVVPAIEGEVDERRFDESSDSMEYHVTYTVDGEPHARWFKEAELEAKPEQHASVSHQELKDNAGKLGKGAKA